MAVNPYDQNLANRKAIEDSLKKPGAVTINGLPTVNEPAPKLTAPTFDANAYYNNQANQYTDIANKQRELALAQFRHARDKGVGEINTLKTDTSTAYQNNRNQTDFQSKTAANKLREMMAAQGLGNSGTNVSGQMRLNAANINALNDLDLGERRAISDYDKQIAEWMDPSQETNLNSQYDIELMRQLAELRGRADDRAYDNDWKTYDANYQVGRDSVADKNRLDDIARDDRWRNVDNGWKARDWQHGLDREKIDDARYADDKAYARKMDSIKLARSGGGGGRSGGGRGGSKSSASDPRAAAMDQILGNVELFRSPADAEAAFFRDEKNIVSKVGREGFNYLINYTRSLPSNFSGGKYRLSHSK